MTAINEQFNKLTLAERQQLTKNDSNKDNLQSQLVYWVRKKPDFFQDDKSLMEKKKKKKRKYTTTRIKSWNFLSSISYVAISKGDFYNENFIFDVPLLITKNLNQFLLDRKLTDQSKHQMIYML